MSFATRSNVTDAQSEYEQAAADLEQLRERIAAGTAHPSSATLAEYRVSRAVKKLTAAAGSLAVAERSTWTAPPRDRLMSTFAKPFGDRNVSALLEPLVRLAVSEPELRHVAVVSASTICHSVTGPLSPTM